MSREIHIDQYIKEKMEMISISYEELYWLQTEKLIEAAEKKKRRGFFFWFFLFSSIGVMATFFMFNLDLRSKGIDKNQTAIILEKEKSETIPSHDLVIATGTTLDQKDKTNTKSNPVIRKPKIVKNRYGLLKSWVSKNNGKQNGKQNDKQNDKQNQIDSLYNDSMESTDSNGIEKVPLLKAYLVLTEPSINLWLTEEENEKRKNKNRLFLGFSTGLTFNKTFSPRYFVGVHLQKVHTKKWSSRLGLQFSALEFKQLNYQYTKKEYSFGELKTVVNIRSNTLYTFQVPLSVHYRVYKHHTLYGGAVYSRYISQKNEISSVDASGEERDTEYGTSKDFRKDNLSMMIGYENIFWRKYQIGLSSQLALFNPVLNKDKLGINTSNKLIETKVYILYNFYKMK